MAKFNINLLILILVILVIIMQMRSCLTEKSFSGGSLAGSGTTNVIVTPGSTAAADGLDLEAVGALLGQAQDAAGLERLLNQENGINNLDLNQDGVVDFISVTEFGSGNERGFALSTEIAAGEEQEIATIRIQQDAKAEQANVQVQGNQALYGPNYYYHSRVGLGDMLLLAWLFRPHMPYYSPFSWGYYPTYYGRGYRSVSGSQYRNRASSAKSAGSTTAFQKSSKPRFQPKASSPKAQANSVARRSSLSNPSRSQRSFRSSNSSIRRPSSFRSGSSFGGGK